MLLNIILPIVLIISSPILLWILGKLPFYIIQVGLRFKIMSLLIFSTWIIVLLSGYIQVWYWIAGLLLIVAFLIFYFMIWSVLCWGYTIRMLLVLNDYHKPVDYQKWQKLHAEPDGIEGLTLNRVQVLKKLGLIEQDSDQIEISIKGLYLAKLGHLFMRLFGVSL